MQGSESRKHEGIDRLSTHSNKNDGEVKGKMKQWTKDRRIRVDLGNRGLGTKNRPENLPSSDSLHLKIAYQNKSH